MYDMQKKTIFLAEEKEKTSKMPKQILKRQSSNNHEPLDQVCFENTTIYIYSLTLVKF